MKKLIFHTVLPRRYWLIIVVLSLTNVSFAQSDLCADATLPANVLTPSVGATCTNSVAGNVSGSTYSAGAPVTCATPAYDVWYTFVATTTSTTVTLTPSPGSAIIGPRIQVFSGACGALVNLVCNASPVTAVGLTAGNTYYIRIFSATGPAPATPVLGAFTICLTTPNPPANDLCTTAQPLATAVVCSNTAGTLVNASATTGIPGDCGAANAWEVWYRFVPTTIYPTITISTVGANLAAAGPRIQLLSGTCGSMTSLACVSGNTLNTSTAVGGAGLTVGATYYIRVYHNSTTMAGATWTFNICVTEMTAAQAAVPTVDFGKSYINVTKLNTGGTVEPGDILEIRATFVVRTNTAYGVNFTDNIPANTVYVPGTLRILTNEGKIYKQWTDAADGDPAVISGSTISINLGRNATEIAGGSVNRSDRPTNFGTTCIMVASYRVQVTGAYNSTIPIGGGVLTYTRGTGVTVPVNFPPVVTMIYQNTGICPNTVGTNAIISEFGGTFGSGNTKDRAASNKVPSNYTYAVFATNAPQDYFYGVSNNTSAGTALANFSIDTSETVTTKKVFTKWDVTGDHTGAANPLIGNLPANTAGGASGGYMVVINSAYRTDTAFKDTISNLCPNTYYEYSAWFRNMCKDCANDSTGKSPSAVGYIPTGPGDSSGVHPTLTFNINGFDYYSTGDIFYNRVWMKKGFTYKTGPAETQMIISIRNNAPGGGGNDWAIDDIGVATCSPDLDVNPATPVITVCYGDGLSLSADVGSYFDNYTYYVWEQMPELGSWSNTAFSGAGVTPTYTGTEYEYSATGPSIIGDSNTAGSTFRLRVASTSANLTDPNCSFLAARQVQVMVDNCSWVLKSDLLNVSGILNYKYASIYWQTVNENPKMYYELERSEDGRQFAVIEKFKPKAGANGGGAEYSFKDPKQVSGTHYYRIRMIDGNMFKYSKVIPLTVGDFAFELMSVMSPFTSEVVFEAISPEDGMMNVTVLDNYGRRLRSTIEKVVKGPNNLKLVDMSSMTPGVYTLQVELKGKTLAKRILKVNR